MKKKLTMFLFFIILISAFGNEANNLTRAVLTDGIIQREPAPDREVFYIGEKAVFFTEFTDVGSEERIISHNWYFLETDGTEILVVSVPLEIKGGRWRTWSSKNLFKRGRWKVELVDENENTLDSREFLVK